MAFAAVVSLLAVTKARKVRDIKTPFISDCLPNLTGVFVAFKYTSTTRAAIALRKPAITKGLHGVSLMKMPAVDHSAAQTSI